MAYIRKLPSGSWQATVRLPDGKRRVRTDPLKGVVRDWAADLEASMRRGSWADPKDGRITLGRWWREWSDTRVIEVATQNRDVAHWRNHIEPRWADVPLSAVTSWDAEAWVASMKRAKVGPTAQAHAVRLLKHLTSEAARHRRLPVDPLSELKVPKAPKHVDRFLTQEEYVQLRAQMPTLRDRALVDLAAMAGLRWGEAAGLHAHRVDVVRGLLTVQEARRRDGSVKAMPKSETSQRVVPMPGPLRESLEPVLAEHPSGALFPGVDYTNWRRRVFVPAVERAYLREPHPTYHDLRHSYGSWLSAAGVPPREIMDLMGHSTLRMTERYMHASGDTHSRALAAMERVALPG